MYNKFHFTNIFSNIATMANKNDPMYEKRKELAIKAFESGCLLFCADSQKWYTPKEFINSNEIVKSGTYALQEYTNIIMHYPKNAIAVHQERLQKAQNEFNSIITKIQSAFEFHPIVKDKKTK